MEFKGKAVNLARLKRVIVLIKSDWNLKRDNWDIFISDLRVLIESDWNLKEEIKRTCRLSWIGINRIILEFIVEQNDPDIPAQ